tara:strand:- start:17362 stop:19056 length:1695 start_codon:yes stop_codon:yes gene_type:complete
MKLTSAQAAKFRDQTLRDTIHYARNVLNFTWANVSIRRPDGKVVGVREVGPEWGISYEVEGHQKMARALDGDSSFVMILMPRGALKSTGLTAFVAKEITRDRDLKVAYFMDTSDKAAEKLEEIKRIFETNKNIDALWGDLRGDKWTNSGFILKGRTMSGDPNASLAVGSPNSSPTGKHYDLIVLDDLVNEETMRQEGGMAKVIAFYVKIQPLLNPGGRIVIAGTRYGEEDLYGWILKNFAEDYEVVTVDCGMEIERDEADREILVGEPTFKHLNRVFLERQLKTMGVKAFCHQYLNRPVSSTRQVFHRHHFEYLPWERWMEELSVYGITDTATSTDDDACRSVFGIIGIDRRDTAYLLDIWFGRVLPGDYVRIACDMLEKWDQRVRIKKILMEVTTANQVFAPLFQRAFDDRQIRFQWENINRGGVSALAKDRRIERLHDRFDGGRFKVVDTIPTHLGDELVFRPNGVKDDNDLWQPDGELVRQFVSWPGTKSKDIPDAIADIDHIDGKNGRICSGMGVKAAKRAKSLAGRKGQRINRSRLPSGRRNGDLSANPWSQWAKRLSG